MMRVEVKPELLRWACERAGFDTGELAERIPQLSAWERGEVKPTLKQIEHLAKMVHAPVGYFFLQAPPVERVPIPDFRTVGNEYLDHPSPDLLDTIYICQQRQEWYRDLRGPRARTACSFVGTTDLNDNVEAVAARIRHALGFDVEARRRMPTWEEALRRFIEQADELGVMVMVNGVVGATTIASSIPTSFVDLPSPTIWPHLSLSTVRIRNPPRCSHWRMSWPISGSAQSALSDVEPVCSPSNGSSSGAIGWPPNSGSPGCPATVSTGRQPI